VVDISHADEQKGAVASRQRSCKECFKQAEENQAKKKLLQEQAKVNLRAMEDWLSRPEVDVAGLVSDETSQ